jgi:hypothetical protein
MTRVEIQVRNGKLIIEVGGKPAATADATDTVIAQAMAGETGTTGGDASTEDTGTGASGAGISPCVVIGPIVLEGCASGGAGATDDGTGGDASTEDTGTGASGGAGAAVVIGPVVVCGKAKAATVSSSEEIEIEPPKPK